MAQKIKIKKGEFIRLNSRIEVSQDMYIKSQKARTGKSEGEILRELIALGIKSKKNV